MNVFVLPSWYPSMAQPMAGLFVRDQAQAVARARPTWNVVVGSWGHHDGALSLRSPRTTLRALAWRLAKRPLWRETAGPVHEVLTPRLSWTLALAQGGASGLLSASRNNLRQAEQRFGRMSLLHAHVGFPGGWIASQLSEQAGMPYVLTEHMGPFPFPALLAADGRPYSALRRAFENAAATIAVSPTLAAKIRSMGLPCSDVIANAVDETRFAPGAADPTRFVFFTLGALVQPKGMDVLLRALARLGAAPSTPLPVELHIGGDGPQRAALQSLAASLGVQDRVRWLGALRPEQVPAHLARCNAFVLASRHETFGVVLAEALMCGKPVLATRCGGPEAIVNEFNGLLVDVDDAAALAARMHVMASGGVRYDAAAIRADALARFSMPAVGERVAALYERVLAGAGTR